jgi:DNA-directed RNA polymerase specialized sigma24 family protein
MSTPDENLGSTDWQAIFFEQHDALLRIAYAVASRWDLAENAVQRTFLKLDKLRDKVVPEAKRRAYLRRMVIHDVYAQLRHEQAERIARTKREWEEPTGDAATPPLDVSDLPPEVKTPAQRKIARVWDELPHLPPKEQEIMLVRLAAKDSAAALDEMMRIEGLDPGDERGRGRLKTRLSQACKRLELLVRLNELEHEPEDVTLNTLTREVYCGDTNYDYLEENLARRARHFRPEALTWIQCFVHRGRATHDVHCEKSSPLLSVVTAALKKRPDSERGVATKYGSTRVAANGPVAKQLRISTGLLRERLYDFHAVLCEVQP